MAINTCTLNAFTVGGRTCRDKFAYLVPILHPSTTGSVQSGSQDVPNIFAIQPPFEFEDKPTLTFEQPWITVEVVLDGKTYSQQLDNKPQTHFVVVTDLDIAGPPPGDLIDITVEVDMDNKTYSQHLNNKPQVYSVAVTDLEIAKPIDKDSVNITAEWI